MDIWAFLIAITLLTLTPGLDTALVIRNTSRAGWKDGVISSLGICSGLFVHALFSAIGISVLLLNSAWLFEAVKMLGAAYLIWLGVSSIRSARKSESMRFDACAGSTLDMKRSFREGLLSNVLNPKTAIFYLAFLPQFIDPSYSAIAQSMILAALHFMIAMVWQTIVALLVEKAKRIMANPAVNRRIESITGAVLIALGAQLIINRQ
ncbi:LysE family translocator [Aliivibrio kagoshimensis]|uniref:LysE family translocator n=1 Tax=Aliivibrio kagoshimensis TaxID=2910230 RepID=UPI003D0DAFF9